MFMRLFILVVCPACGVGTSPSDPLVASPPSPELIEDTGDGLSPCGELGEGDCTEAERSSER